MSLAQIAQAYHGEGTLLRRVEGACLHSAAYIRTEAPETANHANRLLWMVATQADATAEAKKMLARVLESVDIASKTDSVTDSVIQHMVDILIDEFAKGA